MEISRGGKAEKLEKRAYIALLKPDPQNRRRLSFDPVSATHSCGIPDAYLAPLKLESEGYLIPKIGGG
jgi:hypothetical protein